MVSTVLVDCFAGRLSCYLNQTDFSAFLTFESDRTGHSTGLTVTVTI